MRPCPPGLMRGTDRVGLLVSPPGGPTACPKGCSTGVEVKLAEDEFEMMDGLDIKLEELEGIMLEPTVGNGLDISTAVRNRTWPVCPCGLPAIGLHFRSMCQFESPHSPVQFFLTLFK